MIQTNQIWQLQLIQFSIVISSDFITIYIQNEIMNKKAV